MQVQDIGFCPHCGNNAPQELMGNSCSLHNKDGAHNYFMTQCLTCMEALIYRHIDFLNSIPQISHGNFKLNQYELVWPHPGNLHKSVPESVRKIYSEAAAIKSRAPNAFANQIRRSLEALCLDRGANKRILAQNLQELAARGEIPPTLAEMTDVLRQLGNIGSHAGEEEIDSNYVDVIDDFFRAIIEYVYIAPFKVNEFKSRLEYVRKLKSGGTSH
jgi:hypothetical protein